MEDIKFDIIARNKHFDELHHTVLTLEDIWDAKDIPTWLKSDNAEIVAVRRYTGLKDENKKDVFEADLVTDGVHVYEVRWSADDAAFMLYLNGKPNQGMQAIGQRKVIGDIYTTPELLEAKS